MENTRALDRKPGPEVIYRQLTRNRIGRAFTPVDKWGRPLPDVIFVPLIWCPPLAVFSAWSSSSSCNFLFPVKAGCGAAFSRVFWCSVNSQRYFLRKGFHGWITLCNAHLRTVTGGQSSIRRFAPGSCAFCRGEENDWTTDHFLQITLIITTINV